MEKTLTTFHLNNKQFIVTPASPQSQLADIRLMLKLQENIRFQINEHLLEIEKEEETILEQVCQEGIVKMFEGFFEEKQVLTTFLYNYKPKEDILVDPLFKLSKIRQILELEDSARFQHNNFKIEKDDEEQIELFNIANLNKVNIQRINDEEQKQIQDLTIKQAQQFFFTSNQGVQLFLGNFNINTSMNLTQVREITKLDEQIQFIIDDDFLTIKQEGRYKLSDVIQEGGEQIIVIDNRQKKGNNEPIQGSKFLKKVQDLKIYLYPITEKISEMEKTLSKVIMVVGQTGSGKTTLLNSLVNYHMGIEFNDTFRYVVVDEKSGKSQTESQTQKITQYLLKAHQDRPSVIIVDTPGFGDPRGLEQDRLLIEQIKSFFDTQIDQIHAICFVAPANNVRLTPCQKYIFHEVLKLFGKDIAENFVCMITFCDGASPPIIQSLQSSDSPFKIVMDLIKEPWYMQFNNSGIFQGVSKDPFQNQRTKMYWDISMENYKQFYTKKINSLPLKSLNLTKEVLKARENIRLQILELNNQNEIIIKCQQSFKDQIINVENNENQINANQNYDIDVEYPQIIKIKLDQGVNVTNCIICNHTCHLNCAYADDSYKKVCSIMSNGKCTICKNKCEWKYHKNIPYRFDTIMVKKTERCQDIYKAFMDAKGSLTNTESIIRGLKVEFESSQIEFSNIQCKLSKLVLLLQTSALQLGAIDFAEDYIDVLIKAHQDQRSLGWEKSIQNLEDQKIYNQFLQEAYKNQNKIKTYDDFLQIKAGQVKPHQKEQKAPRISMPFTSQAFIQ